MSVPTAVPAARSPPRSCCSTPAQLALVDVRDIEGEDLIDCQPVQVGAAHADAVAGLRLEVQCSGRSQFIADDCEGRITVSPSPVTSW